MKTKLAYIIPLCITILLLSLSFASAEMTWDNSKSFEKNSTMPYGKIIIKDAFGLGGTVEEIELTDNLGLDCGQYCSAQFEVHAVKDNIPLIDNIRFLTIKADGSKIEQPIRSYQFYIQDSTNSRWKNVDVDEYKYVCEGTGKYNQNGTNQTEIQNCYNKKIGSHKEKQYIPEAYNVDDYGTICKGTGQYTQNGTNQTEIQNCSYGKIGTHKEYTKEWNPYTIGTSMPNGKYIVKVDGEKKPDRKVDWQISSGGTSWTNEWAIWGANVLDRGLVSYYDFNSIRELINGINNLTSDGTGVFSSTNCKIGNCSQMSSGHELIILNNSAIERLTEAKNVTTNFWVRVSPSNKWGPIILARVDAVNIRGYIQIGDNANSVVYFQNVWTGSIDKTSWNYVSGNYLMITYTKNESDWGKIYINGTLQWEGLASGFTDISNANIMLGRALDTASCTGYGAGCPMAGQYDEMGWWNRTLSDSEISKLYNNGNGLSYDQLLGGIVNLDSPANNYIPPINDIQFNCSASITGGAILTNISLWTNSTGTWARNQTEMYFSPMSTCYQETSNNATAGDGKCGLSYIGTYSRTGTWSVAAVDTYPRTIDGDWDTYGSSSNGEGTHIGYVNYTKPAGALNTSLWKIKTATVNGNQVIPEDCWTTSPTIVSFRYLSIRPASVGTSQNGFDCLNSTGWQSMYLSSQDTAVNMIFEEAMIWNVSISSSATSTFNNNYPDGNLGWTCQACDSDGDCGFASENRTVKIDTTPPSINIFYPNGTINGLTNGQTLGLNYTISDSNLQACWYEYNGINTTIANCNLNTTFTYVAGINNIKVWANDSVGNIGYNTTSWTPGVTINSVSFNALTYETAQESYSLNATNMTTATLIWNGTSYSATINGDIASRTITIPISTGNKSFYWNINNGAVNSSTYYQYVNYTLFGLCNSTLTMPYINFTFKDESTDGYINGAIDTSTFNYWLGDGSITKSLLFTNITENPDYAFCLVPSDRTLHNTRAVQFSASGYPQRFYSDSTDLTNSTTNKILYLLANGMYVTFFTSTSTGQSLPGVVVTASRLIGGVQTTIEQGTTDASGGVTFWLNPNYDTTLLFVKSGCTPTTSIIKPTQNQYTQVIICGTGGIGGGLGQVTVSRIEGITYLRTPTSGITNPGLINFTFMAHSDFNNLQNIMMQVLNNSGVLSYSSTVCANSTNCQTSLVYNASNGDDLKGRYYIDIGDGTGYILIEGDAHWRFILTNVSDAGTVKDFMTNLKYMFNTWGTDNWNCGQYASDLTCSADINCKYIQDGSNYYCIPKDNINKLEYSKIVLLFLILCIILAITNKITNFDTNYSGSAFMIMGLLIVFCSVTGGLNCVNGQCRGLFYYDGMFHGSTNIAMSYAAGFLNNYILMIVAGFLMVGWILSILRRHT